MLAHSSDFKEAFTKLGRELYVKIEYKTSSKIITEDNKLLLTQDNMQLITELADSQDYEELNNDEIIALRKNNLGELWRTYMKSFDLDTIHEFFVGDIMHIYIGCKVDDDIEYLDYGNYIVYKKEYDENTKAWSYQLCDEMIKTMIPANIDEITDLGVSSCELFIRQILVYCGYTTQQISKLVTEKTKLANYNKKIIVDYARDMKVTCRDLLDYLLALNGVSLVMELDNGVEYLRYREIGTTIVDTLNENIVSGDNARFTEQYGPVNCLVFKKAEGLDDLIKADQQSIEANGETQIIIDGNPFATQETGEWEIEEEDLNYIDNLFDKIKGTSYYLCDFDTIGIGYLEYLDKFRISTPDHIYDTIVLQNTGEVGNGMNESFKINQVKETKQDYDITQIDGKKASVEVDKLRGTIVLKTDSNNKLAQVRLDSSGDDGSEVQIKADSIDFSSHTFNLDTDDINIESDIVDINKNGIFIDGSSNSSRFVISNRTIGTLVEMFGSQFAIRDRYNAYGLSMWRYHRTTQGQDIYGFQMDVTDSAGNGSSLNADGLYTTSVHATNIYYDNLIPNSLEELKKDFEPLDSGLNIIKDIDIYKFRYKDEEDTKKHIGLVIGDDYNYSQEITSNENNGVDLYSFISVCCKAIQEQQEQIEELKKEIDNLKGGNK